MEVVRLTNEQIAAAVVWWTEAIRRPQFHTLERGAPVHHSEEGPMLAEMMATAHTPAKTDKQLGDFAAALAEILVRCNPRDISVDYGPDPILSEAATAAGFKPDMLAFPWKTNMWLVDGKVQVRHGYAAPVVLVYAPATQAQEAGA